MITGILLENTNIVVLLDTAERYLIMRLFFGRRIAEDRLWPSRALLPVAPAQLPLGSILQHRGKNGPEFSPSGQSRCRRFGLVVLCRFRIHHLLTVAIEHNVAGSGHRVQRLVRGESPSYRAVVQLPWRGILIADRISCRKEVRQPGNGLTGIIHGESHDLALRSDIRRGRSGNLRRGRIEKRRRIGQRNQRLPGLGARQVCLPARKLRGTQPLAQFQIGQLLRHLRIRLAMDRGQNLLQLIRRYTLGRERRQSHPRQQ